MKLRRVKVVFLTSAFSILSASLLLDGQQKPVFQLLYSVVNGGVAGYPTAIVEVGPGHFDGLSLFGNGSIYSITSSGILKTIYTLPFNSAPQSQSLVQTTDGLLWGTYGTGQNLGVYFSVKPNGDDSRIYTTGVNGAPGNAANAAPLDAIYDILKPVVGQSATFSKIGANGQITALHQFAPSEGLPPFFAPMVRNADGNFYGVAVLNNSGVPSWIFKITPNGEYTQFVQFTKFPIGGFAGLPLTATLSGNLYGAFGGGGVHNNGEIYKVDPAGALSRVASFPATGMSGPQFLMQASDGNLYGSTTSAPSYIFRFVTATNKLEEVYSMDGSQGQCACVLIEGMDGKLYGTAARGGQVGDGTIFSLDIGLPPPAPIVTEVFPHAAGSGKRVLLWGRYLLGAASVSFNGTPATSVASTSVQSIWTRVPDGATTGPITITTANGSYITTTDFTVE